MIRLVTFSRHRLDIYKLCYADTQMKLLTYFPMMIYSWILSIILLIIITRKTGEKCWAMDEWKIYNCNNVRLTQRNLVVRKLYWAKDPLCKRQYFVSPTSPWRFIVRNNQIQLYWLTSGITNPSIICLTWHYNNTSQH